MKKIVVTGATSMIGVALLEAALCDAALETVYAVVRPNTAKLERLPADSRIKVVFCDAGAYETLPSLIKDRCDAFFHLAWPRTATYRETVPDLLLKSRALQATLTAVAAAEALGCTVFVGAGSQSEYGVTDAERIAPETPCRPVRADGILHLAAGQMARMAAESLGLRCVWMRIFSVYGRYDRENSMISATMKRLMAGQHCAFTACEQTWDYLAAPDIGRAFYLAAQKAPASRVYCVGYGSARPLREYVCAIRDAVAPEAVLGFGELPYPPDAVMHLCADISALHEDTGWTPQIDFETGIRQLYEFERDRQERSGKSPSAAGDSGVR